LRPLEILNAILFKLTERILGILGIEAPDLREGI